MSKPRGKCVFCGGYGLTKGHVWPHWLGQILPVTATHHEHETGRFETFTPAIPGPAHSKQIREGQARSRKPRNTCAKCNSGWMSGIENMAMPYAVPLIRGDGILLSPFAQYALARLICLMAMRMEFLGVMRAVSQQERDWLRMTLWPSEHWKIWIAPYAGQRQYDHFAKFYAAQLESAPTDKVGPEHCNAQVATLVFGELCAHSFYSPVASLGGYEGITLTQIWPASPFLIPAGLGGGLNDEAVLWLHEAFARESRPWPPGSNHNNPPSVEGDHN